MTDFANDELLGYKNVIALPHLGASTPESEDNCAEMAAEQIDAYLSVGAIVNSVNYPACELTPWPGMRICVLHKNVPSMITQITGAVSETGVNIEHMLNKSRKEAAYTVLDLSTPCEEEAIQKAILRIGDVMRVRVIKGK